jgi:hypothetical protein
LKRLITKLLNYIITARLLSSFRANGRRPTWFCLYPVKRAAEDLRLSLTNDERLKEEWRTRFAEERVEEINTLLTVGRKAQVECRGFIDAMGPENWVLCGLTAVANDQTLIEGHPFVGATDTAVPETLTPTPSVTPTITPPGVTETPEPGDDDATAEPDDNDNGNDNDNNGSGGNNGPGG